MKCPACGGSGVDGGPDEFGNYDPCDECEERVVSVEGQDERAWDEANWAYTRHVQEHGYPRDGRAAWCLGWVAALDGREIMCVSTNRAGTVQPAPPRHQEVES